MSIALHESNSLDQRCSSTISLVNVWDHCDNLRALAHAIPALSWARWSRTGNAAARAFAFQGRCFVVVGVIAGIATPRARMSACFSGSRALTGEAASRWIASSGHHKAPSCRQGAATPAQHRMSSGHPEKRCAYWQAGARTCRRYRRNRATVVILASSPYEKGALEIEACPYGSGSPSQDGRSGEYHPLGLPYGRTKIGSHE
jgi:hypothetical protein